MLFLPYNHNQFIQLQNFEFHLHPLKKTPTEGTPPVGPGPTGGQLALKTYNPTQSICIHMYTFKPFLKVVGVKKKFTMRVT